MFSHVMIGSNDIQRSKQFYDALFAAIGAKPGRQDEKGRLVYAHKGAAFMARALAKEGANVVLNGFGDAGEIEKTRGAIESEFKIGRAHV